MMNICVETFWNASLTWDNHRKYPEITECFQNTVILWLPSLWLFVTAPLYLFILRGFKTLRVQCSLICLVKMSIVVAQLSVQGVKLGLDGGSWNIRYIGHLAEGAALIMTVLYIHLENRKGFVTSGILTVYWVLACLCGALLLYSNLVKPDKVHGTSEVGLLNVCLFLCASQLVLVCFADTEAVPINEVIKFMNLGYKRPIEDGDICRLMPSEQHQNVLPEFEQTWEVEQSKARDKATVNSIRKPVKVNLMKVLTKSIWPTLLAANLLQVLTEAFALTRPLVTGLLVGFAGDLNQPAWKGVVYLLAGVTALVGMEMTGTYVGHLGVSAGLRIKACLTNAIFKKSIRLTNKARADSPVGKVINLVSNDVDQVKELFCFSFWTWSEPLEFIVCMIILFYTVDYAVFAGVGVLAIVMPLNIFLAKKQNSSYLQRMEKKDNRINLMTEILNGIKILKLYAWEMVFGEKILNVRNEELVILKKERILEIICYLCFCVTPSLMGLATFIVYVYLSEDHMLTAQTAFRAWATFGMLSSSFNSLPHIVSFILQSSVAIKRVEEFLNKEEIREDLVSHENSDNAIDIVKGTFNWDASLGPCLKNIDMSVPKGCLVAVVGSVGSGKSSLLSAVLGEIEQDEGNVNVDGSIAYVPQQAWIQNNTLKDNILFGCEYREHVYNDAIEACCLKRDLDILPAKDMTEIGEKGINLSGGQKQRVSLARAVYFDADIYLLDDPLSAVDAHVGKDIFENVISEHGLLKNKTRVLVTHGMTWLPRVDKIFVLKDGSISESGTYEQLIRNKRAFAESIKTYQTVTCHDGDAMEEDCSKRSLERYNSDSGYTSECGTGNNCIYETVDDQFKRNEEMLKGETEKCETGKLIEDEEIETGKVQFKYILPYFKAVGILPCIFIIFFLTGCKVNEILQSVCLTEWTGNKLLNNLTALPSDSEERRLANAYYVWIYVLIGLCFACSSLIYVSMLAYGVLRASKILHEKMLKNILRGPMSFFDTTPVGRITNRFSRDIEPLDGPIAEHTELLFHSVFDLLSVFLVILVTLPKLIVMTVPIFFAYSEIQKRFVPVRRQLSRMVSNRRSPVYSHFTESMNGVHVIRAFNVQGDFATSSANKVNDLCEAIFHNKTVDRWTELRLVLLNAACFAATAFYAIQEREVLGAALTGIAISYVIRINDGLQWFVRMSGEMEKDVVCIERIGQYSTTKQEAPLHTSEVPKKGWPDHGTVCFKDYSVRYREGLDLVLKNINIGVKAGEKIGIVGRTGAGKSSLAQGLFRLIEPAEGSIRFDKYDIGKLGLFDLRSNLTILPQEPVLFSGTLKTNLDPLNAHTVEEIFVALDHAHLKSFIDSLPGKLDYECGEGGQNLSVGQRQLICLARSLLRKNSVLILDEATAAVDMKTDELIQNTIKTEFKECTVLTIAHRLNTIIDYDRILVLDQGEVKEFDTPKRLLDNKSSIFYGMARDAGLVK